MNIIRNIITAGLLCPAVLFSNFDIYALPSSEQPKLVYETDSDDPTYWPPTLFLIGFEEDEISGFLLAVSATETPCTILSASEYPDEDSLSKIVVDLGGDLDRVYFIVNGKLPLPLTSDVKAAAVLNSPDCGSFGEMPYPVKVFSGGLPGSGQDAFDFLLAN